jgi:hypothetical protein
MPSVAATVARFETQVAGKHMLHWYQLGTIDEDMIRMINNKAERSQDSHANDMQVHIASRVETFKQDSQLDVVWKMYRVRSLALGISAA